MPDEELPDEQIITTQEGQSSPQRKKLVPSGAGGSSDTPWGLSSASYFDSTLDNLQQEHTGSNQQQDHISKTIQHPPSGEFSVAPGNMRGQGLVSKGLVITTPGNSDMMTPISHHAQAETNISCSQTQCKRVRFSELPAEVQVDTQCNPPSNSKSERMLGRALRATVVTGEGPAKVSLMDDLNPDSPALLDEQLSLLPSGWQQKGCGKKSSPFFTSPDGETQ